MKLPFLAERALRARHQPRQPGGLFVAVARLPVAAGRPVFAALWLKSAARGGAHVVTPRKVLAVLR
jgi:hypothetical protein